MFLPVLAAHLRLATGLRELALDVCGRTAHAMPAELAALRSLTQLENLQLHGIPIHADGRHFSAALPPLTRLTRLCLRFDRSVAPHNDEDSSDEDDTRMVFPWADAVCGLTNLQRLCVTADTAWPGEGCTGTFCGALPAGLSALTALRHFTVLGMHEWEEDDDSDQLPLAALPALETAALQLHTLSGKYPGLGRQQQVVLSRLVSLSLAQRLCVEAGPVYDRTQLPSIRAPALTELTLSDLWLTPESEQLGWLAGLRQLRRLVLQGLETSSRQLPRGLMGCRDLTELVLDGMRVRSYRQLESDASDCCRTDTRLVSYLPASGPYLSKLVRLGLSNNAFDCVPPCLVAATALQQLDMSGQLLPAGASARLQGVHVLDQLPRLREVDIRGFRANGAAVRRFRATNPNVKINI